MTKRTASPAPVKDRYMMATIARHQLGDLTREQPSLAIVYGCDGDDYIGEWATGMGFINVRFPKESTRELTVLEKKFYGMLSLDVAGRVRPIVIED